MKERMVCVIDCRRDSGSDDDYFTLNVWGKPLFSYVVEECLQSGCFRQIYIVTDSGYLGALADDIFGERVITGKSIPENTEQSIGGKRYFVVHGCALMLRKESIINVLKSGGGESVLQKKYRIMRCIRTCPKRQRQKKGRVFLLS